MQGVWDLLVRPDQMEGDALEQALLQKSGWAGLDGFQVLRRSLDARGGKVRYRLQIMAWKGEQPPVLERAVPKAQRVEKAPEVHVVGAGPAGYFAAIRLLELGLKPVVLERGKPVRERRRDLVEITRHGKINPQSNYCFGEGGAGTYSDGKLYTRSGKRGSIREVLDWLVFFGAPDAICVDARPHIGTNKLPGLITQMRSYIESFGGEVRFNTEVTGLEYQKGRIRRLELRSGERPAVDQVLLLTGHSARDVFRMLVREGIQVENKPFALGLRIEHAQARIDRIQYHGCEVEYALPPAYYSINAQVQGLGVYSFCMCPGGIIAPCATEQHLVVTNGWSPSKRNNPFANAGLVTEVPLQETLGYADSDGLHALAFQNEAEMRAAAAGGGNQIAPGQRLGDFLARRLGNSLGACSYRPGVKAANFHEVLPEQIAKRLHGAFKIWEKQMPAFVREEAMLVGVESRTSSPVRIPRDAEALHHPQVVNLFPGGEGAGYAGGIVSAAMDGLRLAEAAHKLRKA